MKKNTLGVFLGILGDEILPKYMGIVISHSKDPVIKQPGNFPWESKDFPRFFSVGSSSMSFDVGYKTSFANVMMVSYGKLGGFFPYGNFHDPWAA